jgi:tetratricopeptide (TPR) repeat protein
MLKGIPFVARLKIARQFRFGRVRKILLGILAASAACSAWAQTVAKQAQAAQPSEPIAISADAPGQASLVAMEAELRRNLELHPETAQTLYRLGLVLRQEGKPKESLETYTRAARAQKPDAEELRSVALDYVLLDDYPDAIHWLETAASLDSSNVEVLYSLARCLYTQGEFHRAETLYLRVLQIKPDYLKAEENLGLAYDAENQAEEAEKALRTAVDWGAKQTSDEWPFLNLGAFLLDHDRPVEAVPFLERAAAIAPKSPLCHEKLGRALEQSGKLADGVTELETAVQLDPNNPNIHFELGHAYRLAGFLEKARAEFDVSAQLRQDRDHRK